jgi:hypothetical protein
MQKLFGDHSMSRDQSPVSGKPDEAIQQYQASSAFQADLPPHGPAGREDMPIDDIDAISLAMRQLYQSPANAVG